MLISDLHLPPGKILRYLGAGTAVSLSFLYFGLIIKSPWLVITSSIAANLCVSPTNGLLASMTLQHFKGEEKKYPILRLLGTLSWMAGCIIASILQLDISPKALLISVGLWIFFIIIPHHVNRNEEKIYGKLKWTQWMGLDTWRLFTQAKYSFLLLPCLGIAIAASPFFPMSPLQLASLGAKSQAAYMSLGQSTEIIACLLLPRLIKFHKIKTIVSWGFLLAILRFALQATNIFPLVLIGISLQGACFAFLFLASQIYLAQNIPKEIQSRAQSFFLVVSNGIGGLIGFYFFGWWKGICQIKEITNWHLFWAPSIILGVIMTSLILITNKKKAKT